ncbi:hypothetical protein WA026_006006 [Henosepilachna vigintioctopunctata]|uniref:Uncharacterized protein n=1 Tax=Henosepilachna vigintioctopunctata TaxID=420089 RepID=A0AAW1U2N2_9CUCU
MVKKRNPNKSLSNEAKYCGICNKDFSKSEYKLLCRRKCTRWICHQCSGLTLSKIKALAEKMENGHCKVEKLEVRIEVLEQEKRDKNIIMTNLPLQKNEDTRKPVENFIDYFGLKSKIREFSAKRLSKKENAPILIELTSMNSRNLVIQRKKEKGVIRSIDLNCSGYNVIYLHEDLSKWRQELFAPL